MRWKPEPEVEPELDGDYRSVLREPPPPMYPGMDYRLPWCDRCEDTHPPGVHK